MEEMQYELREEYRYFAFISYSHKDMSWAKWLQSKLENYRLPAQIRKKHIGLPQKIAPVFRDETDLAGPVLEEALQRELESSQYLIVICSPNSVASSYVNDEIRHFLSLGRKKQIIPFVVEGEPFSKNPAAECFPPAMRAITPELLGINVQEHGKKDAFSRLVATLLRLPADEVVMREKRRENFRRILAAAAAAVLAVVLGVAWWYNTEHEAYFSAYASRYEIPEGIYPLSPSQCSGLSQCYRITTLRGKVIRLETVNALGVPISPHISTSTTEYPVMEYAYDDTGKLIAVIQCDEAGNEVSRKSLTYPADGRIIVEFSSSASGEAVGLSADLTVSQVGNADESGRSMINRQDNTYDENGYLIRSMYYWYNTFHPACDNNGVYGKAYTYTAEGLIETITNLDRDGNPFNCRYGWSTIGMEYDDRGCQLSNAFYSVDGEKAVGKNGMHRQVMTYDARGNLLESQFLNKQGQPCNSDEMISRQTAEYDSRGFMTVFRIFNAQGAAVEDESGVHESRFEYDEMGRVIRSSRLDALGRPAEDPDLGYASVERVFDEAGNVIENRMYDGNGDLLCVRRAVYENGEKVAVFYENGAGEALRFQEYYLSRMEYDRFGNCCKESYYDTDGTLLMTGAGYAARELEYDEFGNVIRLRYYGEDGKLCLMNGGYAMAEYSYVDGRRTAARYFGVQEEPVLCIDGYHECRFEYNAQGFCTRIENYGMDGNLILTNLGYAMAEQDCDAVGNVTEIRYYGSRKEPILLNGEYHKARYRFDSANNMTHSWYYGTDGALTMRDEGYAAVERDFDEYGDTVAWRYYGTENEPILYQGEYHETRYRRDANRNLVELWYYGTEGTLVMTRDGYAGMKVDYDERGELVGTWYYGTDGKPMLRDGAYHGIRWQVDANGNTTHQWYYGTDGNLRLQSSGYAAFEQDYDDRGNMTCIRYYGAQNEAVLRYGQYHEIRWAFDDRGNVIRKSYHGTDGNLILISDGYAAQEIDYDGQGNMTALRFFGAEDEPVMPDGYHEIRWMFDETGGEIGVALYDTDGQLIYEDHYDAE